MTDWLVLLAPLAALPLVWMLGFAGCALDRVGAAPDHPHFFIASAGLNLSLTEISVTVSVSDVDGPKPPQTVSLKAPDIPATPTSITFDQIDLKSFNDTPQFGTGLIGPALTATCTCRLTFLGNPPQQLDLPRTTDPPVERSGDDKNLFLVEFTLTGDGLDPNNYHLT